MEELLRRKLAKEADEKELQDFVQLLTSARKMCSHSKPTKSSWMSQEKVKQKIECLEAYAIDACKSNDQRKTAGMVTDLTSLSLFQLVLEFINSLLFRFSL